jgi:hypothetical protein
MVKTKVRLPPTGAVALVPALSFQGIGAVLAVLAIAAGIAVILDR